MVIRRKSGEPSVLNCLSNREMVKVLKCVICQPEEPVSNIVEETAHPGPSKPFGLRIQI
jgi:hypothetical protein